MFSITVLVDIAVKVNVSNGQNTIIYNNKISFMWFEVLTLVNMKLMAIWDVMPCYLVDQRQLLKHPNSAQCCSTYSVSHHSFQCNLCLWFRINNCISSTNKETSFTVYYTCQGQATSSISAACLHFLSVANTASVMLEGTLRTGCCYIYSLLWF